MRVCGAALFLSGVSADLGGDSFVAKVVMAFDSLELNDDLGFVFTNFVFDAVLLISSLAFKSALEKSLRLLGLGRILVGRSSFSDTGVEKLFGSADAPDKEISPPPDPGVTTLVKY